MLQAERHPYDFTEFYAVPPAPIVQPVAPGPVLQITPAPVAPPRQDRTYVFGAGVGYRMGHNLRIGIHATRTERYSNRDRDFRDLAVSTDVIYGL
jgi:hypothetical protein